MEPPDFPDEIMERFNACLEEDDPAVHWSLQALTRLSGPSVNIVCLPEDFDVNARITPESMRKYLGCSLNLSIPGLVQDVIKYAEVPAAWRKSALLRHYRTILFDACGEAAVGNWVLQIDPELGLLIKDRK